MAGPGFKAVQQQIANNEGVSNQAAGAILASQSRNASPQAKQNNPNLNKVKGKGKPKHKKQHMKNAIAARLKGLKK